MSVIESRAHADLSTAVLTPSRGMLHAKVYASHMTLRWPFSVRREMAVTVGLKVDDAYNRLFADAIKKGCAFALTLEDDMLPPPDVVHRLHANLELHADYAAVSALYFTKQEHSAPLVIGFPMIKGNCEVVPPPYQADFLPVNVIPMGCALWRLSMFKDMPAPWFVTTETETQDAHFCLKARAAGFRFAVDTSIRAGHHDAHNDKTY
jgi:hypothetical protein